MMMNSFFQTWGVRKLTVIDNGSVATSDLVKQSLYIDKDLGVLRATAIIPRLKERCPAVVRFFF
jgi:ubiquitin-like modifier-activating enzyme ATG7